MNARHVARSAFFAALFLSAPVFAQTRAKAGLATLISDSRPAAAPDAVSHEAPPSYVEPASEQTGVVVDFGVGLDIPSGSYAKGLDAGSFGPGEAFSLLLGGYFTPHFGLLAGAHGSVDHKGLASCTDSDREHCGGLTYQFPVVAQYAFVDRKRGAYLQAGLAVASTYLIYDNSGAVGFSSPFDYKLGVGYRISQSTFQAQQSSPSRLSLDLFANLDFGQFTRVSADHASASIVDRDTHYMAELGVTMHWTP